MFNLLFIISIIFTIKELIKEKTEPVTPKGTRFDWDAYYQDIDNGVSTEERLKKRQRGEYMTTNKP